MVETLEERYLRTRHQTFQQLYAGAADHGMGYIIDQVEVALKTGKKIIWVPSPSVPIEIGMVECRLVNFDLPEYHIIPVLESKLHTQSSECTCRPFGHIEDERKVWIHINLMNDHLIDGLDVL